ncbi:MAG: c-type cytochrome [bacterium]|jgi:cytochrome c553|nr:cytochrome c4 [Betaproteobacteria bacterium]
MTRSLAIAALAAGVALASVFPGNVAHAASAAPAAAPAAPKGDPAKGQVIASGACAGCHGADGNSAIPANPTLAGQHAGYTAKQLANFKSGERKNAIMQGFAAALSPQDMLDVAAFYARQPVKPRPANDKELALIGQKLYRAGNAANGLPSCSGCHSPNGAGIPAQYPRLAGQHVEYTVAQLRAFRAGERGNDMNKVMRTIASRLTDREMQALAEYVSGLTGGR